ncbi:MAG: TonB-dependent receptor plug domain-containing protein, partial [Kordiimonadaceae bacterium]|nr:TonB-dependent receptor plug domain-containing protein [Kordiimonadaceae bacterium]
KEYFEKFAPVTLLDMLQRIPGVQEILNKNREQRRQARSGGGGAEAQGGRGFGSGGDQILINGKRLAGKNNNINDTLNRVSANQVEKIELIRGAAAGLDVQSQGLVINITMAEGMSTSTTFWKLTGRYFIEQSKIPPSLLVSHSGSSGDLQYVLSGEVKNTRRYASRDEEHFNALGVQTGEKFIDNATITQSVALNSNISYSFEDGSDLRLNGLFDTGRNDRLEEQEELGSQPLHTLWDTDNDVKKWEIGGDYTRKLGGFGQLKALFVVNNEDNAMGIIRDKNILTDVEYQYGQETTNLDKSEKIFRVSLTNNLTSKQSIEAGGEAAFNTFDKAFVDNRRSSVIDPLSLRSSDNVAIKENRYEIFANHTYNFSPSLVLQSSVTTEFSKIVADSITTNTQRDTSFTYLKPRMNLRYDFTSSDQLRLTVEKKVSQLNFNNFVTSFDQRTDQLVFGNTEIRPEQVWDFSAVFEHRFPNDAGSVEAEIFYRDYTDHITKVDFTEYENLAGNNISADEFFALPTADLDILRDTTAFTSKSGNIDGATAKGIKLKTNLRLGFVGLPQAVVSLGYVYEKRRELDQFTLDQIGFNRMSDHTFTYSYRHDITAWDFSYGIEGSFRSKFGNRERNYTWPWKFGPGYKIFAEKTIAGGYKLIAEVWRMDMGTGRSTLTYYDDHRRFNDVIERSEKLHKSPAYIRVILQGTF